MNDIKNVAQERKDLIKQLYPDKIPALWCPLLVHYNEKGHADHDRIETHLNTIHSSVHSFLIFGTVGDGWDLKKEEKIDLLKHYIELSEPFGLQLLVGVLHPQTRDVLEEMKEWVAFFQTSSGINDPVEAMKACHVYGFAVCPPVGKNLPQSVLYQAMRSVMDLNLPTVLYQLPQVTQNEISPESVQTLSQTYPNFYMLKDSSGTDGIVCSGSDYHGVFCLRGMEGAYTWWYHSAPERYNGFLLSTGNCLGDDLKRMLTLADEGHLDEAKNLSDRIERVLFSVIKAIENWGDSNPFARANKCLDHIMAYGDRWKEASGPLLYSGKRIPFKYLEFAHRVLEENGWTIKKGYLENR